MKLHQQVLAYEHRLLFDDDAILETDIDRLIRKWKAGICEVVSMKNFMDFEEFRIYRDYEDALNDYLVTLVEVQKARLQMTAGLDVAALHQNLQSNIKSSNKSFYANLLEANYLEIASKVSLLLCPIIEESGRKCSRIQGRFF